MGGAAVLDAQRTVDDKADNDVLSGINPAMDDKAVELRALGDDADDGRDEQMHGAHGALAVDFVRADIVVQRRAVHMLLKEIDRCRTGSHDVRDDLLHGRERANPPAVTAGQQHGFHLLSC